MQFGLMPPFRQSVVTDGEWVRRFVKIAEDEGTESLWTVEHPIIAEDYTPLYDYSEDGMCPFGAEIAMPDPLGWLSFAASVSTTIKLGTAVILLPLYSPIMIAKTCATLDALSGGRLLLGIGLGWQREEFDAVHVPYNERGMRADEIIEAIRVLWQDSPASYDGKHYAFHRVNSEVKPARGTIPIIVGGSSEPAARRAGRLGDGFFPHAISPDDLAAKVDTVRRVARECGRDPDAIAISVAPCNWNRSSSLDLPLAKAYAQAGATRLVASAEEASSFDHEDVRRFITTYRDRVIENL